MHYIGVLYEQRSDSVFWKYKFKQMQLQCGDVFTTPPKRNQIITSPRKKQLVSPSANSNYKTPPRKASTKQKSTSNGFNPQMKLSDSPVISPFYLSRLDQDYIFIRQLGNGNFSDVALYQSRLTKEKVAIKIAKTSSMSVNEVQALGALAILVEESNYLIRYFHSWIESNTLYLVMEHCDSSLQQLFDDYKDNHSLISEVKVKEILKQALIGLSCLHRHQIVHLDIKPENLLLLKNVLKISDLGLARSKRIKKESELEEGDARYLALEVLNYREGIDLTKADIFSLGMTIYQGITYAKLPNNGPLWTQTRTYGLQLHNNMDLTNYSTVLLQLLQQMTHPDWKCRPSAKQLLNSQFFKQVASKRLNVFRSEKKQQKNSERSV